ncbi:xanthine dehydrogenase family protein molybdopterin-binding subunit [Pseudonocardia asaccharolytica]|uniref:Aldehyde dehydrogenase n=1 Tax=Pseudonocardia asaccharolytica DSM 44247 = NBRC 16224 TaxID=1123024 RepID=A0A511D9W1_9PSEU|nr:xanthine dehydrogenase family protein molybdopterin-binding subunit [Pseudonocardia asaccharolytica]GEL19738.1 aldehyde dehydrogenase [Pseudonocardia asaccharolytica DSM 44247 = NBRC 16224]
MTEQHLPPGLIGARVRRKEDPRLLTGRAQFVDDVALPGMLEAAILRSPHAHARIVSVDVSAALELPGVFAVITGAEVAQACALPQPVIWRLIPDQRMTDLYALAHDKVRYVGQGVAAVAAADRYVAEDALGLIEVEYEQLPAACTLDEALADGAPLLYENWPDNVSCRQTVPKGDVATAFAAADVIVSETITYGRQMGTPLETRGAVVSWDPFTDRLEAWLSTQSPNLARDLLGEVLGLPVERIRVRTPDVGGGFGNKFDFYGEEVVAALLSKRSGRPVKIIEDRLESFVANAHSREQRIEVEVAAKSDGTITGMRGTVYGVLGGQLSTVGIGPCWAATVLMPGPYDIPNVEVTVVGVVTNRSPYGSYRGWGQPKANIAHERIVEKLARELGMAANDVRRKNLIAPDKFPYPSPVFYYDSGRYEECLEAAERAVVDRGWAKRQAEAAKEGRSLGIGYSFHIEISAIGPSRILNQAGLQHSGFDEESVRIDSTGGVIVRSGLSAMGQGIQTALAQVAAQTLGVPLDSVTVLTGDTETNPYTGYGTGGSRGAALGGGALLRASTRLREKVLRVAAELLEASPDDLVISDGRISVAGTGVGGRSVSMRDVGDATYRRLDGKLPLGETPTLEERDVLDPDNTAFSYGTTAVLAEVDRETGRVQVLDYLIAHDCGTVINPMIVDGQLHGGAAQAIGGALFEEIVYGPDGQPLTTTFMDYLIPTASELPAFETVHLTTTADHIPGGFKGMGEAGTIGGASAITAAIDDALRDLGVGVVQLPITPPRLLSMIEAAEAGGTATDVEEQS